MIAILPEPALSIWTHSQHMRELYARRARDEDIEMTCAAQAAGLLGGISRPGETLLDVGCGSGWFSHSLRRRGIALQYHGIDPTDVFVETGRTELARYGLAPGALQVGRAEYVSGAVDHVLCMNVLSNIDNWHRSLDRFAAIARKSIVLRESLSDQASYDFVEDRFLDDGVSLKVHVNTYARQALRAFLEERGFDVRHVTDERTGGQPELVIGYPHHWEFLVAVRRSAESAGSNT